MTQNGKEKLLIAVEEHKLFAFSKTFGCRQDAPLWGAGAQHRGGSRPELLRKPP